MSLCGMDRDFCVGAMKIPSSSWLGPLEFRRRGCLLRYPREAMIWQWPHDHPLAYNVVPPTDLTNGENCLKNRATDPKAGSCPKGGKGLTSTYGRRIPDKGGRTTEAAFLLPHECGKAVPLRVKQQTVRTASIRNRTNPGQ